MPSSIKKSDLAGSATVATIWSFSYVFYFKENIISKKLSLSMCEKYGTLLIDSLQNCILGSGGLKRTDFVMSPYTFMACY